MENINQKRIRGGIMERKEFLKSIFVGGVCSCFAFPLFSEGDKKKEKKKETEISKKKFKALEHSVQFVQVRMPKLVNILDKEIGTDKTKKILTKLGNECANIYAPVFSKYKNNLEGLLKMMEQAWKMKIKHDKEKKIVTIIGTKTGKCVCPFVKETLMSKDFCNCSLGWQENTFASIIGKPVKGKVLESVLRGSKRCSFAIDYS